MKKIYLLLLIVLISYTTSSQNSLNSTPEDQIIHIDQLSIFPNPVQGDKLYITSKLGKSKIVTIFNVLGARVLFEVMTTNELNISSLNPGIYVIKVKEDKKEASRKLVIN